jgi:hypothetical protein
VALAGNPRCRDLSNPLFLQIGDTQEPLIKSLGRKLRDRPSGGLTLVYYTSGSCTNTLAFFNHQPLELNMKYVPSVAESASWTPDQPSLNCDVGTGTAAVPIDVANSNVLLDACTETATPPEVGVFKGPIQSYVFVVPSSSPEVAITAEEAYFVFGFGMAGMAMPWIDETLMFIRPSTKSTLVSMAANISVPANRWRGMRLENSTDVLSAVAMSPMPNPTIGILGSEIADPARNAVHILAYRAYEQWYAYYPDSTPTAHDKQNVRDGHYTVWSPTVYMAYVDGSGHVVKPEAEYLVDLITGKPTSTDPGFDPLRAVVEVGLVPECAMKVSRDVEGGPLSLFSAAEPCGCAYDALVGPPRSCMTCTSSTPCAAGTCRYGYCEAR